MTLTEINALIETIEKEQDRSQEELELLQRRVDGQRDYMHSLRTNLRALYQERIALLSAALEAK